LLLDLCSLPRRYEALWKEIDFLKQKVFARNELKLEELGIGVLFFGSRWHSYRLQGLASRLVNSFRD
jgi:hypothetical protein